MIDALDDALYNCFVLGIEMTLVIQDNVPFLRVGRESKIHQDIKPYSVYSQMRGISTTDQLSQLLKSKVPPRYIHVLQCLVVLQTYKTLS